tara:strand:+ start:15 stop:323 length:309 start_codon:yes stop_codon:yes gene_type:complete
MSALYNASAIKGANKKWKSLGIKCANSEAFPEKITDKQTAKKYPKVRYEKTFISLMENGNSFCEMEMNIPIIARINKTRSPATCNELITIGKVKIRMFTTME